MTELPPTPPTIPPSPEPQPVPNQPNEYASFWSRVGATLLDRLLYGLVGLPLFIIGAVIACTQFDDVPGSDDVELTGNGGLVALGFLIIFVGVVLPTALYLHALATSGRPWGSRIVGLQVVNPAGAAPGWGAALLRTFTVVVAGGASGGVSLIGYLWMLGDDHNQTWFDKISRTFVLRDQS